MAETIPPCIDLIILGFVANLSIGGLFMAGLLPAGLMALVVAAAAVLFGSQIPMALKLRSQKTAAQLWGGATVTLGLVVIIFGEFKTGFATATEISAFAALYALTVGAVIFRELSFKAAIRAFVLAATRSGLVLFIVAAANLSPLC
jgi:TRAP-type C4-dicarboxylate transport system permease large subunit